LLEVDFNALCREALALKNYIENAPADEEKRFYFQRKLVPLINAALRGALVFPFLDSPYDLRRIVEGYDPELPAGIQELYFVFVNRIQGSPALSSMSVVEQGHYVPGASEEVIGGERYEWVIFEE
jgi:hypothetical protein